MANPAHPPLLDAWRQGDFTLAELALPFIGSDNQEMLIGDVVVPGAVLISQSCDIVRSHEERPFVQVAALRPATPSELDAVKGRSRPRYAYLEPLRAHGLVVDLDLVAMVAKETVMAWERHEGCADDAAQREFAAALARHKQRFAFPDEFNAAVKPLRRWIERRAGKGNAAGAMLRAIEQIRVRCGDWRNPHDDIELIGVLLGDPPAQERAQWAGALVEMEKVVREHYPKSSFRLATWEELSAADYLQTDRLDLDGLSDA